MPPPPPGARPSPPSLPSLGSLTPPLPIRPAAATSRAPQLLIGVCVLLLIGLVLTPRSAFSFGSTRGAMATDVSPEIAEIGAGLDGWWSRQLSIRDRDFVPVGERLTDGDGSLRCMGKAVVIDETLHRNAWASTCREGPTVAFDPEAFVGRPVAMEFVLAHEWGHIVQFLHRDLDVTVADPTAHPAEAEMQADCFAGAWASGHIPPEDHNKVIDGVRATGDPRWVRSDDPNGHGTSEERMAAFQVGVMGGVDACLPPVFNPR